jgi:NADPH:quinone reductase-like Zn-dependent oxidoreductase
MAYPSCRQCPVEVRHFVLDHASFEEQLSKRIAGRGVDVVLNSLAGPLYEASLRCLAPCGRSVDIGKVDIHAAKRLNRMDSLIAV